MKMARDKRIRYISRMSKYTTSRAKRPRKVKEAPGAYLAAPMNSIELFAGAGGLGLGIAHAGFVHRLVVERDGDACGTIRANFGAETEHTHKWPLFEGDVRQCDFSALAEKIDLVSGGPPCQPFSIGGKSRGFKDRRDMFPEAARIVRIVNPKAFIFENVKGLLRESFAKYFQYIILQLKYPEIAKSDNEDWTEHLVRLEEHHTHGRYKGLYYRVLFRLVNAADYGVPQKRERVIIVGFRSDVCEDWSFPIPTHSEDALLQSQFGTGKYWERHAVAKRNRPAVPDHLRGRLERTAALFEDRQPWLTVRDAFHDLPDPQVDKASDIANHRFQPGAKAYPGHTGSPLDEPAKTLKAGDHGVPGGENMLVQPDGSLRYFTVREGARLQTFPDWFIFKSSWTESMRQIGNAVPVQLANVIAGSVADRLRRFDHRKAS
jgi:DNA (cytosine-5)-methyltransferase 1